MYPKNVINITDSPTLENLDRPKPFRTKTSNGYRGMTRKPWDTSCCVCCFNYLALTKH